MTGEIPIATLLNFHGIFIVGGGLLLSMLLNTPMKLFIRSMRAVKWLLRSDESENLEDISKVLVKLAEDARTKGLMSLKDADPNIAGGFLGRIATSAAEFNELKFIKELYEDELNKEMDSKNEVVNFYRTMGMLAPMFGLIGTLLGIIKVLKELSNPEMVGPAQQFRKLFF
ncbi:MAG: MotA/TolQ/ExbB proton channel family protein [Elusimicrobiota bacterium]|nr:MotA/TolQ/ExbB proton channel family protein [Elusimicrobiota bacterium]